ncbi:hypothetical protein Cpir12675_006999 [Ceratocystis pirilliformis]|uniref:Retrotransposon gag domain-containing protein n=1 Tax=Ceratocystis pirilliformis TaxID=259994 RepID=A0ABR3YAM9_9PEZI
MEQIVEELLKKVGALETEQSRRRPRTTMPDVEKFDGKSHMRFRIFVADIKQKQIFDCEALGGEMGFISYIYSRLADRARDRIGPYMASYYSDKDEKEALKRFYAFLEETFADPTSEQQAAESLSSTKMGDFSLAVAEYVAQMELLFLQANGADWLDLVKVTHLKDGLSIPVSRQMQSAQFPNKYADFKKELLALGIRMKAHCYGLWSIFSASYLSMPSSVSTGVTGSLRVFS